MIVRLALLTGIVLLCQVGWAADSDKTAGIAAQTPAPTRFIAAGSSIIDRTKGTAVFFRGLGYSPYLRGETPLYGAAPPDDGRYAEHLPLLRHLGVNYLHVFPMHMPAGFFAALDDTDIVYGQDIWMNGNAEDFLGDGFQARSVDLIRTVFDHSYRVGRLDRLVLFSIEDL
jgi:hypothetical protein